MEKGEVVTVTVTSANKGGLMVRLNRITGFLPVSQLAPEHYPRVEGGSKNKILERLKKFVNKKLKVKIIDVSKEEKKLIVSERETIKEKEKEKISKYKVGDIVEGEISGLVDFGAFLKFDDGLEGLIHLSELDWQRIEHPREVVKVGQKVKAKIISILKEKYSQKKEKLLKQQADELAAINQDLKEFAYIVSHDLKAPLRAISSLVNWLACDYKDKIDEKGKEMIDLLLRRVKRMHDLIEGVLKYSRVGRIREEKVAIDLNPLVENIIEVIDPPENIEVQVLCKLPTIVAEKTRVEQVFQNLISNAVKYMDKPVGKININCVENGDYWLSLIHI